MFLIEATPALVLGFVVFYALKDRIEDAPWLSASEKRFLSARLEAEAESKAHIPLRQVFANIHVWHLSAILFTVVMALFGVFFWLPTLVNGICSTRSEDGLAL